MSRTVRPIYRLLAPALLAGACSLAHAQGVTIGGTPAEGEATGMTAMFAGDRFENFRNMDRFMPTSTVTPSPDPWDLGENADSVSFTGDFMGKLFRIRDLFGRGIYLVSGLVRDVHF